MIHVAWWVQVLLYVSAGALGLFLGWREVDQPERARLLVWLRLVDPCTVGRHDWSPWHSNVTQVPVVADQSKRQVGWEYYPLMGPSWRACLRCPALERKT